MRVLRFLWRGLVAAALILLGRRRREPAEPREPAVEGPRPRRREARPRPRVEAIVLLLLGGASASALVFSVLYVVHDDTQLLGLALGLSLICLAGAAILAGKRVVPQETAVEERPELLHEHEVDEVDLIVARGSEGISRRRLLVGAAGAAGLALGAALVVPAASLGPNIGRRIEETPWRIGRRLVDEKGEPLSADDIEPGSFVTAFPEGADPRELGSPVVVVQIPVNQLDLPEGRESWAPEGILAFSKICTHAGCAVALYRTPLYEPTSRAPALVCPCHYSTFDVRRGAAVIFGPAGRPLPQLPLTIDRDRTLVARGGFSGPVGPAWWSVRRS